MALLCSHHLHSVSSILWFHYFCPSVFTLVLSVCALPFVTISILFLKAFGYISVERTLFMSLKKKFHFSEIFKGEHDFGSSLLYPIPYVLRN